MKENELSEDNNIMYAINLVKDERIVSTDCSLLVVLI